MKPPAKSEPPSWKLFGRTLLDLLGRGDCTRLSWQMAANDHDDEGLVISIIPTPRLREILQAKVHFKTNHQPPAAAND